MTLQAAIASELPFLRAEAAATMLDTLAFGTLTRGGQNDDGEEVTEFVADFTTPGKVASDSKDMTARVVTVGGVERPVISGGIHIPYDRPETVPAGTYVRVEELGPASPEHMLGRLYRVEGESVKSYQTARRFDVVEV